MLSKTLKFLIWYFVAFSFVKFNALKLTSIKSTLFKSQILERVIPIGPYPHPTSNKSPLIPSFITVFIRSSDPGSNSFLEKTPISEVSSK